MVIDVIFFIVFVYSFYMGFSRGIIKTIFVVFSFFVGFVAALKFTAGTKAFLETSFTTQGPLVPIMAFVLTFVGAMLIIRLFASAIERLIDAADLELLNKFAGGILFCALGLLLYSGILIFFEKARLMTPEALNDSFFFPHLKAYPDFVKQLTARIFPAVGKLWNSTMDVIEQAEDVLNKKDSINVN